MERERDKAITLRLVRDSGIETCGAEGLIGADPRLGAKGTVFGWDGVEAERCSTGAVRLTSVVTHKG
jgi:hypothetical protein